MPDRRGVVAMNRGRKRFVGICRRCDRAVWTRIHAHANDLRGKSEDYRAECRECERPVIVYPAASDDAAEATDLRREQRIPGGDGL